MIEFKNVTKVYSTGTYGLENVSLTVDDGEFVFIVGTSGAGKSTLLKLIMHEENPSSGEIIVDDQVVNNLTHRQVPYFRRKMGIVFQDFRLIDKMTVFDNVAFAMRVIGAQPKDVNKRVNYILDLVGLSKKAKSRPSEISGGEQQRVSLARALVNNPCIIIADEPTGNVDPKMSYDIMELLNKINATGTTVIVVTHEKSLVKQFDKRVIRLKKGKLVSDTAHPEIAEKALKKLKQKSQQQPQAAEELPANTEETEPQGKLPQKEKEEQHSDDLNMNKYDDLIRELTNDSHKQ